MSNMLSQDEIDALLKGSEDLDIEENENANMYMYEAPPTTDYFSPIEQDALGEIGNISFGSSATALSTLLNQKVDITTPTVSIIHQEQLKMEFPHPYVAVQVKYTAGLTGSNLLVVKQSDAAIIADLMLGGDGTNPSEMLDEIQVSAVQEAMNQMMGSAATSMSTVFNKKVDISPPSVNFLDVKMGKGPDGLLEVDMFVKVSFRLKIGHLIDSNIMQLLPIDFAKNIVNNLLNPSIPETIPVIEPVTTAQMESAAVVEEIQQTFPSPGEQFGSNERFNNQQVPYGQPIPSSNAVQQMPQHLGFGNQPVQQANIQPVAFSNFEPVQLDQGESNNLNMLLDIPLQVTVELGRTKRSVREILDLSTGSIIELDKLAGEPVDILVNNKLIAKGEVVVIDENFGVRVTDILSQSDRIKKLR